MANYQEIKDEVLELIKDEALNSSGFLSQIQICIQQIQLFIKIFDSINDFYDKNYSAIETYKNAFESKVQEFERTKAFLIAEIQFLKDPNSRKNQNENQVFQNFQSYSSRLLNFNDGNLRDVLLLVNTPYFLEESANDLPLFQDNLKKSEKTLEVQEILINKLSEDYEEKLKTLFEGYNQKLDKIEERSVQKEYIRFFHDLVDGEFEEKNKKKLVRAGYKQLARRWLRATIYLFIFGLAVLGLEIYFSFSTKDLDTIQKFKDFSLYIISLRTTVYIFIIYLIFTAYRNYANNTHLMNIYRQKIVSLNTYYDFLNKSITDNLEINVISEIRKNMAEIIARTIFEPVDTGYIKQSDGFSLVENITNKIAK